MTVATFIHDHLHHAEPASADPESTSVDAKGDPLPYPGYDHLHTKQLVANLHEHSQVELAAVEAYERSHRARKAVLDKLHFLRRSEPVAGYDALSVEQIVAIVKHADLETLDQIRFYERKFANRPAVLDPVIYFEHKRAAERPPQPVPAYRPGPR